MATILRTVEVPQNYVLATPEVVVDAAGLPSFIIFRKLPQSSNHLQKINLATLRISSAKWQRCTVGIVQTSTTNSVALTVYFTKDFSLIWMMKWCVSFASSEIVYRSRYTLDGSFYIHY